MRVLHFQRVSIRTRPPFRCSGAICGWWLWHGPAQMEAAIRSLPATSVSAHVYCPFIVLCLSCGCTRLMSRPSEHMWSLQREGGLGDKPRAPIPRTPSQRGFLSGFRWEPWAHPVSPAFLHLAHLTPLQESGPCPSPCPCR